MRTPMPDTLLHKGPGVKHICYYNACMDMSLRWIGPILDCSGYASAARGYLRACERSGINVQAKDRSRSINLKNKGIDEGVLAMYERLRKTPVPVDCPAVQHQVPDAFYRDRKARLSVGYTIFEMTRIPDAWVGPCNGMDAIWTGSQYSKGAFGAAGVTVPIEVLPHAIDLDAYSPAGPAWDIENRRSFAFLSVFDFTARKAWRDLLRAYWNAFSKKDDVCLILKCYFGDFSDDARKDIIRRIARYKGDVGAKDAAPILLYGHDVPSADMPSLYRAADCYVGVSREGFGLSYAEAMACGLPCIGPERGGTREYMTDENSYLVRHVEDEPISPEVSAMFPAFEGLEWARHDWEHLSSLMRKVREDEDGRAKIAERGLRDVTANLSYEKVGGRIKKLLT